MVLFLAGMDTTAHLLNMAIYFLSQNPDCLQKVRDEASRVLGKDLIGKEITID